MNRKNRTTILVKGNWQIAGSLAQEIISKYNVRTIQKPSRGLVMIKVREGAQNSVFYLGEMLVTECKVQIDDKLGVGIIHDDNPEMAYNLAVIDAAYNACLLETSTWKAILFAEEERIRNREAKEMADVLKTKVDFTTMDV
ncbi:phosphonate C-P lyase system protein PhnG [Desulfitibacter alkalitolerans]|uniref:phosphonate C-P lyase system protein PhnG n=1 Tax=Desulfitibacter alkalitolerans TaxID=264641 RepID=UPI0004817347|nr:phosphonate C-P lyase system protein PhnG [Desulfitibacter alkalitolerans]